MFLEINTTRNETLSLNISHIISVVPDKKGVVIFDSSGIDYSLSESYDSVMERIYQKITPITE